MISRISDHYIDTSDHKQYSRIVGGLAWPTLDKEGFMVVVGEEFLRDEAIDANPLHLLAEVKAKDLSIIGRLYGELTTTFFAGPWVGNPDEKFFMHHMRESIKGFSLIPAPHYNDPESAYHYKTLIYNLTDPQRKVLNLGDKSRLVRGFLNNLIPRDLTGKADEKPILAAMGYAVAQLSTFKRKETKSVSEHMESLNAGQRW